RQTEVERPLVVSKCEGLRQFLAEQECLLLARLGELDEAIGRRREENATHLGEEISRLSALITELEGKRQQPVLELLQGVRSAVSRYIRAPSAPTPRCAGKDSGRMRRLRLRIRCPSPLSWKKEPGLPSREQSPGGCDGIPGVWTLMMPRPRNRDRNKK
ncbi:unnamed protein product, partial [Natator depressus]